MKWGWLEIRTFEIKFILVLLYSFSNFHLFVGFVLERNAANGICGKTVCRKEFYHCFICAERRVSSVECLDWGGWEDKQMHMFCGETRKSQYITSDVNTLDNRLVWK